MDTNTVVDYFSNQLPDNAASRIDDFPGIISIITRIELLGWYRAAPSQITNLKTFVTACKIYGLTEKVAQEAISIRQQYKIKTPDAIIAATAIIFDHKLLTRNVGDFKNIVGLDFENPWLW